MTKTLVYGYSSESTQRELSTGYQQDRVCFQNVLHPCVLAESIVRVYDLPYNAIAQVF